MNTVYMLAFEQVLLGLGLSLVETDSTYVPSTIGSESEVNAERMGQPTTVDGVENWDNLQRRFATIQCDYSGDMTFLSKLKSVGEAIQSKMNAKSPQIDMMPTPSTESDFGLLRILEKAALIPYASKPCILWGSRTYRNLIIEAGALENRENKEGVIAAEFLNFVHPVDELLGLDMTYMEAVREDATPIAWLGPFGPQNSGQADDFSLPGDVNKTNSGLEALRENQPHEASRMPIFTFGTRNSNILSVDFDIDAIYWTAMNLARPAPNPALAKVSGLVPTDFKDPEKRMWEGMQDLDYYKLGTYGVPLGFQRLVEPYLDSGWGSTGVKDFDDWSEIFDSMGVDNFKNIEGKSFKGYTTRGRKMQFYTFMWEAFRALYSEVNPTPKSIRNYSEKNTSEQELANSVRLQNEMLSQVIHGKITTTPLFNLSSMRTTMRRSCLLYCIEPRFSAVDGAVKANSTWFSGLYQIWGWIHKITPTSAGSTFVINRAATSDPDLLKEEELEAAEKAATENSKKYNTGGKDYGSQGPPTSGWSTLNSGY